MTEPYATIVRIEEKNAIHAYEEGRYADCAIGLKTAAKRGSIVAQGMYADICYRNLDGKNRSKIKAAFWYLVAALMGDPNIYSYIASVVNDMFDDARYENLTEEEKFSEQLDKLTTAWEQQQQQQQCIA